MREASRFSVEAHADSMTVKHITEINDGNAAIISSYYGALKVLANVRATQSVIRLLIHGKGKGVRLY